MEHPQMNPTPTPSSPPVDIARLRELEAKATPGPLKWDLTWNCLRTPCDKIIMDGSTLAGEELDSYRDDADLIAALRNAAPALLDEIDRLREQVVQQNTRNANAIKEGLRYLDERDKLREEVEMARSANLGMHDESNILKASLASIRNATQVERFATTPIICARIKTIISERDSLRQQNEQLLKEIEELKKKE